MFKEMRKVSGGPASIYRDASDSRREVMSPDDVMPVRVTPRVLLVDDDPTFCKVMKRAGLLKGVTMTCCATLGELSNLGGWDYDVAIVDYDLGAVTGFELASYFENFTKEEMPIILVSQTKQKNSASWPPTIREFVHKSLGPFAILEATFEAHEVNRINKKIRK